MSSFTHWGSAGHEAMISLRATPTFSFSGLLVQAVVQAAESIVATPLSAPFVFSDSCVRNAEVEGSIPFRSTRIATGVDDASGDFSLP